MSSWFPILLGNNWHISLHITTANQHALACLYCGMRTTLSLGRIKCLLNPLLFRPPFLPKGDHFSEVGIYVLYVDLSCTWSGHWTGTLKRADDSADRENVGICKCGGARNFHMTPCWPPDWKGIKSIGPRAFLTLWGLWRLCLRGPVERPPFSPPHNLDSKPPRGSSQPSSPPTSLQELVSFLIIHPLLRITFA